MNGRGGRGQDAGLRRRCRWARRLKPTLAWARMLCEHPNQKKTNPPPQTPKTTRQVFLFSQLLWSQNIRASLTTHSIGLHEISGLRIKLVGIERGVLWVQLDPNPDTPELPAHKGPGKKNKQYQSLCSCTAMNHSDLLRNNGRMPYQAKIPP